MSAPEPITLEDPTGFSVRLSALGAAVTSIRVPSPVGPLEALLRYPAGATVPSPEPYYLGVTLGRVAGRLEGACVRVDGERHGLAVTPGAGGHTLHGGPRGFSRHVWAVGGQDAQSVTFRRASPAGEEGFPGRLDTSVRYTLGPGHRLTIELEAGTDAPTPVNLSNHAYFNLDGVGVGDENRRGDDGVREHVLSIAASRFLPLRDGLLPTGVEAPVAGTPFDLRAPAVVGDRLQAVDPQLALAGGFDHCFVLDDPAGGAPAATLVSRRSGLRLRLYTTQPAVQCYTGQGLGPPFAPFEGLCLEAQRHPNAANTPGFPDTVLRPGQRYRERIVYAFDSDPEAGQ